MFSRKPKTYDVMVTDPVFPYQVGRLVGASEMAAQLLVNQENPDNKKIGEQMGEVVLLDDALTALAKLHPRQSQVVELRFFAGLEVEETAEALGISTGTVKRDWSLAKAWLRREMSGGRK